MILNIDEFDKVVGEIYIITNLITNKCYVGQTRSHRKNHEKYRPFGYLGRFKGHIHEAYSTKTNACKFLNSTILKHGTENFKCEKILTCAVDELDFYEKKYISEYNTKYPNGYNLTDGGQGLGYNKGIKIKLDDNSLTKPPPKEYKSLKKSDETKLLISKNIKEALSNVNHRKFMMKNAQKQHYDKKFEKYRNVIIDENNIDNTCM
jgi:group I intron endonuclease